MFDDILHLLTASSVLRGLRVVELITFGQNAFRAKLRADVAGGRTFQVWLNHNHRHTRYAYQLYLHDQPILRWDNAPHHPEQSENFPHHFHDEHGQLRPSPLSGDPISDLPAVLNKIQDYLHRQRERQ
jgi:hypothetical protein